MDVCACGDGCLGGGGGRVCLGGGGGLRRGGGVGCTYECM